jgi:TolB-like protein
MASLIKELKRRNVFRVATGYLILGWVVLQITDIVAPALHLPEWTMTLVLLLGVIGFPFALFFAWAFELTPEGLKREHEVDRSQSITQHTGRKVDLAIIALLVVALAFIVWDAYLSGPDSELPLAEQSNDAVSTQQIEPAQITPASIAVLPFDDMSPDKDQEYFSDGIAEELLNALAQLKNLQVAARTSSFAFKGKAKGIAEIGKLLNVDTVLEGSVRKSGTRLRITAQLINVEDGYHLWSETYDRELTDVFAVQDELTKAIVGALRAHLDFGQETVVRPASPTSVSAYDAFLQGRHYLQSDDYGERVKALPLFRKATDIDPGFAPAWAARATTVMMMREDLYNDGVPRTESRILAQSAVDRALAIDSNLAEAYIAQGLLHEDGYRFEDALFSLEKAVEINPNLAEAWVWRSRILGRFGRVQEARENMLKALRLDPQNAITAIFAANLAVDFHDPEFFAIVERNVQQFSRPKIITQWSRLNRIEPFNKEAYEQIVATPGVPPGIVARMKYNRLKEMDEQAISNATRQPGEQLMWAYMEIGDEAKALALYDALPPERQEAEVNLEELSIMQAVLGRCEDVLETLKRAHGDELRIYGLIGPNAPRSNSNLALNRAYCMQQMGDTDQANKVLAAVNEYVQTLRENTIYGIFAIDAKLQLLQGNVGDALDILAAAHERSEIGWTDRHDPVLRTLIDEPRFQQIFDEIDSQIDALRDALGMPPASF